jgi:hypothetical protein
MPFDDPTAERVRRTVVAVAARVRVGGPGVGHQQVGALGEPEDAEHRRELVDVDQALGGQPVGVEEVLLLDEAANAGLGQLRGQFDVAGKGVLARKASVPPACRRATSLRFIRTRVWAPPPIFSEL